MINIKEKVYQALCEVLENVTDQYPKDWEKLPAVQYTEEDNKVYEHTDTEEKSYVRYRVDVWHNRSTSEAAMLVDEALGIALDTEGNQKGIGLIRILCQDTPDPSGLKHKVMRYEAIIDNATGEIYWPD